CRLGTRATGVPAPELPGRSPPRGTRPGDSAIGTGLPSAYCVLSDRPVSPLSLAALAGGAELSFSERLSPGTGITRTGVGLASGCIAVSVGCDPISEGDAAIGESVLFF